VSSPSSRITEIFIGPSLIASKASKASTETFSPAHPKSARGQESRSSKCSNTGVILWSRDLSHTGVAAEGPSLLEPRCCHRSSVTALVLLLPILLRHHLRQKCRITSEVSWANAVDPPRHVDMEWLSRPRDGFARHRLSALLNGDFTKFGADRLEVGFHFSGGSSKALKIRPRCGFRPGNNAVSRRHINQNLAD